MKAKLGSWKALPLMALSSLSFAGEPLRPVAAGPLSLSIAQMDGITAGASTLIVNGGVMNIDTLGGSKTLEFVADTVKVLSLDTVRIGLADGETTISGSAVKVFTSDGTNLMPGDLVQLKPGESIRLTPGGPIQVYIGGASQSINMETVRLLLGNARLKF